MAHWQHEDEREDGDTHSETADAVVKARRWLRGVADRSQSPTVRGLMGDLRAIEQAGEMYYMGLDYDDDRDDVDEMGPF